MEDTNKEYLQQEGETFEDWKLRLIVGKIEREIDLDWSEIKDLLNIDCSADHLRKTAYGMYEVYQYMKGKNNNSIDNEENNTIDNIEKKRLQLELERKKKQTISIEYNKILREQARNELIWDEVRKSIKKAEPPIFNEVPIQNRHKEEVLALADIHYGKQFKSLTNEYSCEIAKERMELLLSKTVEICDKEQINHLTVCNIGDDLEGLIHIDQLKMLQMGLIDATIDFARFMAGWLNKLSQYVYIDYKHIISSNHTEIRPFNSKAGQFEEEDLEKILVNYIHDVLVNNERINVQIPEQNYIDFNLLGYNFIMEHGQNVKNIKNEIRDVSINHRKLYDYCLLAHYHHGEEITTYEGETNNCEVMIIPSIMGCDKYADDLKLGSKASAKLLTFEEGLGHTRTDNIILN